MSELSRFIIIILSAIYAYLGFSSFLKKEKREGFLYFPILIILFHFTGFLSIYLKQMQEKVLLLYFVQLLLFIAFSLIYHSFYRKFSKPLFYHMNFLIMTGYVFVTRLNFLTGVKQTVFASASMATCLLLPYLIKKMGFLRNMGYLYALVGIGSLGFVLLKAETIYGAKNWITIFGYRFQPSEFVKIALIFMIASLVYVNKSIKQIVSVTVLTGIMVLLLVLEKDLGGALLYFTTFVVMIYYATGSKKLLLFYSFGGMVSAVAGYFLFSHVRVRVVAFLDPWKYIDDKGYQVTQSLFGIGTGGWFGFGLGNGSPKSTPVVESDFVFSGLSEELGLLFGFSLILIYLCTFLVMIFLASKTKNEFHRHISVGCLTMYSFQVLLAIGGTVKFIPSTGVTLPFISTGGSSMISMIVLFSVIQGLYISDSGQERKSSKRRNIHKLAYLLMGFFGLLMLYLTHFELFVSPKVMNNAYNRRLDLYEKNVLRGKIYSADGLVLAETKVDAKGKTKRVYPYKNLYSHVIGRNENGKTGIEAIMNYELYTSNDEILKRMSERITGVRNKGDNILSTIDSKLQTNLERAIGNHAGAGVIMEADTGKILALVSKPDYDTNLTKETWEEISSVQQKESKIVNRATNGLYPPGSTFKILTALAYLREKKEGEKFSFDCHGIFKSHGNEISCYNKTSHGKVNLEDAFAYSCNGAFGKLGLEMEGNYFKRVCEEMLFNRDLPFPLTVSKSSFVLDGQSEADEKLQTGIGQGKTQITPVHNALIASVIANEGVLMQPFLVEKIVSFDGKRLVKEFHPKEYGRLLTKKEAKNMKKFMEAVVKKGTAKKLSGLSYPFYGKTGTAEYKAETGEMKAHSWFTGFLEKKKRKWVISIVIEGEKRGNYSAVDACYQVFSNLKQ